MCSFPRWLNAEYVFPLHRYEATRELPTRAVDVTTPVSSCTGRHLKGNTAIIPILRAGLGGYSAYDKAFYESQIPNVLNFGSLASGSLGMTEAMLELLPNAAVHHIGMYRMSGCEVKIDSPDTDDSISSYNTC